MQLEEQLGLRRVEIENLQAQLGRPDSHRTTDGEAAPVAQMETVLLREQLLTAGREHYKESSELKEKYEAALAASQRESESLKAALEKQSQEISETKQKVQQANKENMEMMDSWKVFVLPI